MIDQSFIVEVKKNLTAELLRIDGEISRLSRDEREELGESLAEDIDRAAADAASLEKDSQIEELKSEKEGIVTALKKIGTGQFGLCEKCGKEIDRERLTILPSARLCMNCKIICDNCGEEIEEARILGKKVPIICQNCEEEVEPETYFSSSSIKPPTPETE